MSRSPLRHWLINAALAACSLALPLALLEAAARIHVAGRIARPMTTRGSIVRYNPTLGWDKPPEASARLSRPEYHVDLKVNSLGLRGPERPHAKPSGVSRVLLLGDSFTEGYTVREDATVRAELERLLNGGGCAPTEVLNGGTMGYSTDQELLFYQQEGRLYSPDVVAVLFCWNDVYFNTTGKQGKPYFQLVDGKLVLNNSPVPRPSDTLRSPEARTYAIAPWRGSMALRLLSDRTRAGNPGLARVLSRLGLVEPPKGKSEPPEDLWPLDVGRAEDVEEWWQLTQAILAALRSDVEAAGGRLVLFYIPDRAELSDTAWRLSLEKYRGARRGWRRDLIFDRLRQVAEALELPLVDPRAPMRSAEAGRSPAYFAEDGHWTEVGHAIAARELDRVLVERRIVACDPAR